MPAVDAIGRASRASPASKGTLPFIPTVGQPLSCFASPQGLQGLFHCMLYPHGQHVLRSPSGTPVAEQVFARTRPTTQMSSLYETKHLWLQLNYKLSQNWGSGELWDMQLSNPEQLMEEQGEGNKGWQSTINTDSACPCRLENPQLPGLFLLL